MAENFSILLSRFYTSVTICQLQYIIVWIIMIFVWHIHLFNYSVTMMTMTNSSPVCQIATYQYPPNAMVNSLPVLHNSHIPCKIDKNFEIPRKDLILEEVLGEGEFGKVVSARANNIRGCSGG